MISRLAAGSDIGTGTGTDAGAPAPVPVVRNYSISADSYNAEDEAWQAHLGHWKEDISKLLHSELDRIAALKAEWTASGSGLGLSGVHAHDFLHHCAFASSKCASFEGRNLLVEEAMRVALRDPIELEPGPKAETTQQGSANNDSGTGMKGVCLAVVGQSGCGKTALMSAVAARCFAVLNVDADNITPMGTASAAEESPTLGVAVSTAAPAPAPAAVTRPVIIRFCGTNTESVSGLNLVLSISRQIRFIYGCPITLPDTYIAAVDHFQKLLQNYPVVLFIDSIDQLTNDNHERSEISFLTGVKPHPDTRIIVSTLPDDRCATTGGRGHYFYGCDTLLSESNVPRVTVPLFGQSADSEDARGILTHLISRQSRTLTSSQWDLVMNRVSVEPTALYLSLAVSVIEKWRSSTPAEGLVLVGSVPALVDQILQTLETDFGHAFVQAALGLITVSKAGVNDTDMQDLLSVQEAVVAEVFQYSTLESRRIPFHVWARLRSAINHLVVERNGGRLALYHRQLLEAAGRRFDHLRLKLHESLGRYYGDLFDVDLRKSRHIAQHTRALMEASVWLEGSKMNEMRCSVAAHHLIEAGAHHLIEAGAHHLIEAGAHHLIEAGAHHLIEAGCVDEAYAELCCPEAVCAYVKCGEGYNYITLLDRLRELLEVPPAGSAVTVSSAVVICVDHYLRWARMSMTDILEKLTNKSRTRVSCAEVVLGNCLTTQPVISVARSDVEELLESDAFATAVAGDKSAPLEKLVALSRCELDQFSVSIQSLNLKHASSSLSVSSDGGRIAVAENGDVSVWDARTGAKLLLLEGHKAVVSSLNFSADSARLISASFRDGLVIIWDVVVGDQLCRLAHTGKLYSLALSVDSTLIALRNVNTAAGISIWSAVTGEAIRELKVHVPGETTGKQPKRVGKTKDTGADITNKKVIGGATFICFYPCGGRIATASHNGSMSVLDSNTGAELLAWKAHGEVCSVNVFPDGGRIVCREKYLISVWDALTAAPLLFLNGFLLRGDQIWSKRNLESLPFYLSSDGSQIVTVGKQIKLWNSTSGVREVGFAYDTKGVRAVCMSRDGRRLVTTSTVDTRAKHSSSTNSSVTVYDLQSAASGSELVRARAAERTWNRALQHLFTVSEAGLPSVNCAVLLSEPARVIASLPTGIAVKPYGVRSNEQENEKGNGASDIQYKSLTLNLGQLPALNSPVSVLAMSPDGTRIVSAADDDKGLVLVWNATTGAQLHELKHHGCDVRSLCVSPDGRQIVSGGGWMSSDDAAPGVRATMVVWNIDTGEQLKLVESELNHKKKAKALVYNHTEHTTAVCISADNKHIACGECEDYEEAENGQDDSRILRRNATVKLIDISTVNIKGIKYWRSLKDTRIPSPASQ